MRTISKSILEFSELSPKAQAVAIETHKEVMQANWEPDFIEGEWIEKLNALGFNEVEINYNLGYCQGSGARFTAKSFDLAQVLRAAGLDQKYPLFYAVAEAEGMTSAVVAGQYGGHYVHENTVKLDFSGWYSELPEEGDCEEALLEYVRGLCKEIYTDYKKDYEVLWEDETAKEDLEQLDYEFYETGKRFNG